MTTRGFLPRTSRLPLAGDTRAEHPVRVRRRDNRLLGTPRLRSAGTLPGDAAFHTGRTAKPPRRAGPLSLARNRPGYG